MTPSTVARSDRARASEDCVDLLDVDPELGRYLTPEERNSAAALRFPVLEIRRDGPDLTAQLEQAGALGGILVDGLLIHEIGLGGRSGMRLLGPGDLVILQGPRPMIVTGSTWLPARRVHIAVLGAEQMAALDRWPRLTIGFCVRLAQQVDRLTAQLLVCQLPRVEDRVLALMWLLAESWGRVTPSGTRLPLDLTHEAIGSMVGARRPTVSLALRALAEEGAMVRQEGGWLLLKAPDAAITPAPCPNVGLSMSRTSRSSRTPRPRAYGYR